MKPWMWFVLMTVVCWGAYVPTIHEAQNAIGGKNRGLWTFMFVGVAYFAIGLLGPIAILAYRGELTQLPGQQGAWLAIVAGIVGAVGAFGVILAMMYGGKPLIVPPLIFAGAPIVATLVTMLIHRPAQMPSPMFFVGILMAAAGAALVLRFKPA